MNIKVRYALSYETPENYETHDYLGAFFNIFFVSYGHFTPGQNVNCERN